MAKETARKKVCCSWLVWSSQREEEEGELRRGLFRVRIHRFFEKRVLGQGLGKFSSDDLRAMVRISKM